MANKAQQEKTEVLERGNIFFMYRAKIQKASVEGIEDIQRFELVMSSSDKDIDHLITIGQKKMPDIDEGERNWGFVTKVGRVPEEVENELERETYQTKTSRL